MAISFRSFCLRSHRNSFLFSRFANKSSIKAYFYEKEKFVYTGVVTKKLQFKQKRMFSTKSENLIMRKNKLFTDCYNLILRPKSYHEFTDLFDLKAMCVKELESSPYKENFINFVQEVLAKDINQYLNEIYKNYKYLLLLPKTWDENTSLDITFLDFIIFASFPNDKERILIEDNKHTRYNILYTKNNKTDIILDLNKQTPSLLTEEEFYEINFTNEIFEELHHEVMLRLEKFIQNLELFVRFTKLLSLFERKEDGLDLIISFFEIYVIFQKLNLFSHYEEINLSLYKTFRYDCADNIFKYLSFYELSPVVATQFCKEFRKTVAELNEGKGLLFEVLGKLNFSEMYLKGEIQLDKNQTIEDFSSGEYYWAYMREYILSNFIYRLYIENPLRPKDNFEDTKNKMIIILLDFREIVMSNIVLFLRQLITLGQNEANKILVEKNALDNLKKILEPYFQSLENFLKEKFNLTKEELCVYPINLVIRELIMEYYILLENFMPTEKNDFDKKINEDLNTVSSSSLLQDYKELEKYLDDYILTQEVSFKNLFCEKLLQNPLAYKENMYLILLYELKM